MKKDTSPFADMPIGFAMSISRRPEALRAFAVLPDDRQDAILARARDTHSKVEMERLVENIITSD